MRKVFVDTEFADHQRLAPSSVVSSLTPGKAAEARAFHNGLRQHHALDDARALAAGYAQIRPSRPGLHGPSG